MERIAFIIVLGLLLYVLLQMTKPHEVATDEYVGEVEKPDCESCALTSLEPARVCPSGMCSQNNRLGCKV